MNKEAQLGDWITQDPMRMQALRVAAQERLPNWCIAAGFVRNLAWDRAHGYPHSTPLNDIDLIYFDADAISENRDRDLEKIAPPIRRAVVGQKSGQNACAESGPALYLNGGCHELLGRGSNRRGCIAG